MSLLNDWSDYLRLLNLVISTTCVFLLQRRFIRKGRDWNTKTKDYWFALVMWSVAGAVFSIEGLLVESPNDARSIFILAASSVTLLGITRKGPWGS